MEELAKTIKQFLYRDLIFILGGASVFISLFYVFDRIPINSPSIIVEFFCVGVSYVIGYVVQDTFSILRIVTSRPCIPWPILKTLYKKFEHKDWPLTDYNAIPTSFISTHGLLDIDVKDRIAVYRERFVALRQIGSTIGPCWILTAMLLFSKCIFAPLSDKVEFNWFDLAFALSATIAGLALIVLSWLKTAQLLVFDYEIRQHYSGLGAS